MCTKWQMISQSIAKHFTCTDLVTPVMALAGKGMRAFTFILKQKPWLLEQTDFVSVVHGHSCIPPPVTHAQTCIHSLAFIFLLLFLDCITCGSWKICCMVQKRFFALLRILNESSDACKHNCEQCSLCSNDSNVKHYFIKLEHFIECQYIQAQMFWHCVVSKGWSPQINSKTCTSVLYHRGCCSSKLASVPAKVDTQFFSQFHCHMTDCEENPLCLCFIVVCGCLRLSSFFAA